VSVQDWLQVVATVYRSGAETWTEDDVAIRRVSGGRNNALYHVVSGHEQYACKLCVIDERHRAEREYSALRLLQEAGADLAPEPVLLDASTIILPFPVVIYRWLPGVPLEPPLTPGQLSALVGSVQRMHAIRRDVSPADALPNAVFHWFDFRPYLAELRGFLSEYGSWLVEQDPDGRDLEGRLARLVTRCADALASSGVSPDRDAFPLCLCRVDHNLANTVWEGNGPLRWVDWEYAGWGDPALDLADLRWHVSLEGLSQTQHAWLREAYRRPADDASFDQRVSAWDQLLAVRWPFLLLRTLWSAYDGLDRVRLTRPDMNPQQVRAHFIRTLERAEAFML
jgi:aminoglycoside phosphotransferase (APT) family kinase protein